LYKSVIPPPDLLYDLARETYMVRQTSFTFLYVLLHADFLVPLALHALYDCLFFFIHEDSVIFLVALAGFAGSAARPTTEACIAPSELFWEL
jgi:hypothetical protein